jgi:hypothetical protein
MLSLGTLAYAVAVVLFVIVYGQPEGTGPSGDATLADRVAHYQRRQAIAHAMWFVETLAAMLIAIAGFVLQHRKPVRAALSPRVAWATVSVGAVLLALMYPIMLGGYPAAASSEELALFDALNGIATFLFHVGNVVVGFGLAGAFFTEAAPEGVVPRWLALIGVTLFLISAIAALGLLAGVGALENVAPLALVGFLLAAYLGLSIWEGRITVLRRTVSS